jgi:hypothetical protein
MHRRTTLLAVVLAATALGATAGGAAASPNPEPGSPSCSGLVMAASNHASGAYGASGNPTASAGAGYFLGSSTHDVVAPYVSAYCSA